ncbi:MAG: protein translocase subunit SecD, partial [bacterium]|nr:protein translocase subunit SecD [bacterium]
MNRRSLVAVALIVAAAAGLLAASLGAGNRPLLGLDLKGGVEVVLVPVDDPARPLDITEGDLDTAVNIIRDRIDGLGVAEPDVTRQGGRVVVQLPGISDQQRAIDVVGQTAELRFRPVCAELLAEPISFGDPEAEVVPPQLPLPAPDERGLAPCPADVDYSSLETSPPAEDELDRFVVLPQRNRDGEVVRRFLLGPSALTGAGLSGADSTFRGQFAVDATFKGGDEGADQFDEIAVECFSGTAYCPPGAEGRGLLAIVVDGNVSSAPLVNAASFDGQVVITGNFSEQEADDLALVLRYGALPIEFQDPTDPQSDSTSRAVSATIGGDSLRAGVIAGIAGLALVFLFMIGMYRLLGLIAMLSLGLSATLLWVIVAWLGETQDLALTLAGVTGLIVSIGVSLDSNVVYFEHLKEDVATGRTLRSSLELSFPAAFRTIFWANFASLIAAVILYWLSAGSVRGFALMLGLASVLDLVATYFFLRPCALLMSRSPSLMAQPRLLGLPAPEEAASVAGVAPMSRWRRLWRNQTRVDFPGLWKKTLRASAALILIGVVALLVRGVNLGIEFEGGTVWEASAPDVSTADVRDALRDVGQADAKIQFVGGDVLRVRAELDATDASSVAEVSAALAGLTGQGLDDISFNSISASWGGEITEKAVRALIVFFVVVAVYITLRLEWRMAVAALVAVAHDIVITVGIYALFQFEVTPATVIAFLTIMGYSLYDT